MSCPKRTPTPTGGAVPAQATRTRTSPDPTPWSRTPMRPTTSALEASCPENAGNATSTVVVRLKLRAPPNQPARKNATSATTAPDRPSSNGDNHMRLTLIAAVSGLALAGCSQEQSPPAVDAAQDAVSAPVGQVSAQTMGANMVSAYVPGAAMGDMYEIQAADIALERSTNARVKELAQMIKTDHTAASNALKAIVPTAA